jgi:hypothetical protein
VLTFQQCDSFEVLTNPELPRVIENSPWIFYVKIFDSRNSNLTNDEIEEIDLNLSSMSRSILVSIDVKNTSYILDFKNENFDQFLSQLNVHTKNLTDSNFLDKSNRITTINLAIKTNCTLCLRVAYTCDSRYLEYLILIVSEMKNYKCGTDCFRAIMNLPYDFDFSQNVTSEIYALLHKRYIKSLDSLKTELELGVTKYTITREKAMKQYEHLAELAAMRKEFDVLDFLIRADFPFPLNLNFARNSSIERDFNDLVRLHFDIASGNLENIRRYVDTHPHTRFARFTEKSALMVAWESKNYKVFSFLKSKGMIFSNVNESLTYYWALKKSSNDQKLQITNFNWKFLKPLQANPAELLIRNTKINYEPQAFNESFLTNVVHNAYRQLFAVIPEILTVVASSEKLEIHLDFTDRYVNSFILDDASLDLGRTFYDTEVIAIGAKNLIGSESFDRLETISHEMTHFAMFQLYRHGALPYDANDTENEARMENITEECRLLKSYDPIIGAAFDYEHSQIHQELIARAASLVVIYHENSTVLKSMKRIYESLFNYYENKVLSDIKVASLSTLDELRRLNQWFDVKPIWMNWHPKSVNTSQISELNSNKNFDITCTNDSRKAINTIINQLELPPLVMKSSFARQQNFQETMTRVSVLQPGISLIVKCDDVASLIAFNDFLKQSTFGSISVVVNSSRKGWLRCDHYENYS